MLAAITPWCVLAELQRQRAEPAPPVIKWLESLRRRGATSTIAYGVKGLTAALPIVGGLLPSPRSILRLGMRQPSMPAE